MGYRDRYRLLDELTQAMKNQDWDKAVGLADRLYAADVHEPEMMQAVCAAYIDSGSSEKAQRAADWYAARQGQNGISHFYLGRADYLNDDWQRAEQHFLAALEDQSIPTWYRGAVHSILGTLYRCEARGEEAAEHYLQSFRLKTMAHGKAAEYSNYLFNLHYLSQSQPFMLAAAREYGRLFASIPRYTHADRKPHQKLRIGYLSPDLHFHVVAFFSYAFFNNYDKRRFEVYCYTTCIEDAASQGFRAMVDGWKNVRGLSDARIAQLIYEDEIDILVDLAGHTGHTLLPVMAYKPASVQVSGIGYFDTTGLPAVDYFLADGYTDPVSVAGTANDAYFTEKLLRLPHSHFCFMWHDAPDEVQPLPCQHNGYITFGSLNNFSKVTDAMLRVWSRILERVPGSRLYLKAGIFNNAYGRLLAERRIEAAGIPLSRVIFRPHEQHYLRAYHDIDIALDTYPYPGGGTTCDALYMGVPVITLTGERHNARFGFSLLKNIGLEKCCAAAEDEYIARAVALAGDRVRLGHLRRTLRRRMRQSPVMQADAYMAEVEQGYEKIWQVWQEQAAPMGSVQERFRQDMNRLGKYAVRKDWDEIIRLAPSLLCRESCPSHVWSLLGMAYYEQRNWQRAAWWLAQAAEKDTVHDAENYRLLASACQQSHRFVAACQATAKGLAVCGSVTNGFRTNLYAMQGNCALILGQKQEAADSYHRAVGLADTLVDRCGMYSSWLFATLDDGLSPAELSRRHLGYNDLFATVRQYVHSAATHRHKRLRLGYLSPDCRRHVMFYFYYQLLAGYSADQFEVYVYSLGQTQDGFTESIRQAVDQFEAVSGLDYAEIARRIYADEIDILVDLAGHSANSGLPVLAWKPAPVQISGLGYPGVTGLAQTDYFLTDRYIDTEENQEDYRQLHERPIYLTSQFCYTGRSDVPACTGTPAREKGYIQFGVFNQYRKLTDPMLRMWQRIMTKLPTARLLLKDRIFADDAATDLVYERLAALGLDLDRITFEGASDDYMERYLDVDIALDTYPYPGGGTTCDALYMGVPVVSQYGWRRGSRFGLSILQNAGLGELAVDNEDDYEARVLLLAEDWDMLDLLHKNLRRMMLGSRLMDTRAYVQEAEQAYREKWKLWSGE